MDKLSERRGELIERFVSSIPEHVEDMPIISSNGVTRTQQELKYIVRAMADEIAALESRLAEAEQMLDYLQQAFFARYTQPGEVSQWNVGGNAYLMRGNTFREAIAAAIAAKEGK